MREDDFTNTPEDAAAYEAARGRAEWIGEDAQAVVKPFCSVCQGGVRGYVCGPCARDAATKHEHGREESGRLVRLACSCGHKGKWRSRSTYLLRQQLHSDDGEHLSAVRRGIA